MQITEDLRKKKVPWLVELEIIMIRGPVFLWSLWDFIIFTDTLKVLGKLKIFHLKKMKVYRILYYLWFWCMTTYWLIHLGKVGYIPIQLWRTVQIGCIFTKHRCLRITYNIFISSDISASCTYYVWCD